MGLNDNIIKISRNIEEQQKRKEFELLEKEQKTAIKMDLRSILRQSLIEGVELKKNIYNEDFKINLIDEIIEKRDAFLINKGFTSCYLDSIYYVTASEAERIVKRSQKFQEQLQSKPIKKEELKLQPIRAVQPVRNNYSADFTKDLLNFFSVFLKIFTCSVGLAAGFITAMSGNKKRKIRR